jgi:hypothetical protein
MLTLGPSNQKRDLRYIIALAKELDAGIIPVGLQKHFLDRWGDTRSAEEVLGRSRQKKRQMEAGGNVANAALVSTEGEDDLKDRRLEAGSEAKPAARIARPEPMDETHTPEGVPYCLGTKLSQYMPPRLLFDW